ncbi:MAG: glycosyltransferase [Terriglobia bacterium]
MRALIAIDHHFARTRAGEVYLGPPMSIPGYQFWQRYLAVFDEVVVLARVRLVEEAPSVSLRADGPGVLFHDLPDYLGPWQYAKRLRKLRLETESSIDECDAYILRIPGAIGHLVWKAARRRGLPIALEVVADPWDILSPGATKSIVRPVIRRRWSNQLRQMCGEAAAVCYVTREALQKRYPPGPSTWSTYASDVELADGIAEEDRIRERISRLACHFSRTGPDVQPLKLGFLGSLAQMYKAPDVLLQASAACLRKGLSIEVSIAGDGKFRSHLEKLTVDLDITRHVFFLGALSPGTAVSQFLDQIDLFVLPSRQEGLPRALVEAMARGCPCIGSTVGGIPELLQAEDMVPPGDVDALAGKILEIVSNRARMEQMSQRNLERSREYLPYVLSEKRRAFYQKVREQALRTHSRPAGLESGHNR